MAPSDLDRLAGAAQKRRHALGLALNDKNAKAAGTSKGTWQRVERGEAIRPTNYVKIDALLRWAPGSCAAVLEGRDPVPIRTSAADPEVNISEFPASPEEQAKDVLKLAALASAKGMTADEILKFSELAVRDLRARGLLRG